MLAAALIILLSLSLSRISGKIGLPTLVIFIGLGMLFGQDGLLKIPYDDYALSEQVCSLSLVLIMFYGGFGTDWKNARPGAGTAMALSSAGTVLTALLTGLFCHFVLKMAWLPGLLTGAVISSTDAASVFSILRSRRLNLRYGTASVLEVESGSNDPFAYMLTIILVSLMNGSAGFGSLMLMLVRQLLFGALVGPLVALGTEQLMKRVRFQEGGQDSILIFGAALLSYGVSAALGGNGYLSVYLTGIILGNRPIRGKKELVHFFDGVTGLTQILIFFLLGLLSTPSQLPAVALPGLMIALFLTFVARPAAVWAIMEPKRRPKEQQMLVSWCGLRGASSIVFAIMAMVMSPQTPQSLFNLIFFIVLFSIIIQGTLIPAAAKALDMIDRDGDVMKTFSDYTEQIPIQYLKLHVDEGHPWAGKTLTDIQMLPQTRVVLIIRGGAQLIPRGDTTVSAGDTLIVSGPAMDETQWGSLTEVHVTKQDGWHGKALRDIGMEHNRLIIMILRGGQPVIPEGGTVLETGDVVIINELKGSARPAGIPETGAGIPAPAAPAESEEAAQTETEGAAPAETEEAVPAEPEEAAPAESEEAAQAETEEAVPAEIEEAIPAESEEAVPAETEETAPAETEEAVPAASPADPSKTAGQGPQE